MEICVNEYVRTKGGHIRKVSKIMPCYENELLLSNTYYIEFDGKGDISTYKNKQIEEFITKHSFDIKDLVQAGDLIKISEGIYEVIFDESYQKLGILVPNRTCLSVKHSSLEYIFNQYKDVEILTKEQFNQMKYIVGDESNEM